MNTTKGLEFRKSFGPGKCSKCGIYIEEDIQMYIATNLSGRPSMTKDQLLMVEPEFCEKCHARIKLS